MDKITCFDEAGVKQAQAWLRGERPIPDINNAVDVLGEIESFNIEGW